MKNSRFRRLLISLSLTLGILISLTQISFAREDYFKPALGEVLATSANDERAVTTEEGTLVLFSNSGDVVAGYPLTLPNNVITSSPLLVELTGDSLNEIVFIARNDQNVYTLYAYSGDRTLLTSIALTGQVYFDPVAMNIDNAGAPEIIVTNAQGTVVSFSFQNNIFSPSVLLSLNRPAAISFKNPQQAVVTYPEQNVLELYSVSGGSLTLAQTHTLTEPLLYPAVFSPVGEVIYDIDRSGRLAGIDLTNGQMVQGFPISFSGTPLDSPLLVDFDTNSMGMELGVSLSNGSVGVVTTQGVLLRSTDQKSFLESSLAASEPRHRGFFSAVRNFGVRVVTGVGDFFASIWSRVKIAVGAEDSLSSFSALRYSPSVISNGVDRQVVELDITTDAPANVDEISIIVNYPQPGEANNARGYFQWDPVNGCRQVGGAYYGNQFVDVVPADCRMTNYNAATRVMTFSFPFTLKSNYGIMAGNTVAYHFSESRRNHGVGWRIPSDPAPFTVNTQMVVPTSFASLEVRTQRGPNPPDPVRADGQDWIEAELVLNTSTPDAINSSSIMINYPQAGQPNTARGLFQWDSVNGFTQQGGGYYGNQFVVIDAAASQRIVDAANNRIRFIYRWRLNTDYGDIQDNDIFYHVTESVNGFSIPWSGLDTNFDVQF